MSRDSLVAEIFHDLFTKEEWELWTKGEFNLFDNYAERVGMPKEDADRLREKFTPSPKKTLTKSEVKSILNHNERNNT